jgi:hypothetical protein
MLFVRAVLSNQLARLQPLYLKVGNRSGRGYPNVAPEATAEYFRQCVRDYLAQLGQPESFLKGKQILEYGPGDTLGVGLVLYALGAKKVVCVDRFPLRSKKTGPVYRAILDGLSGAQRERGESAYRDGELDPAAVEYRVTHDGISGARAEFDLILSRSVLALVNRLDRTLDDIASALRPGGVSIHKVDLSSHGLDRYRPLDFLTWPDPLYRLMYSRKGRPNRWRADKYQELARRSGLQILKMEPTGHTDVAAIRESLASPFRAVPDELLGWLGFWILLSH